MPLCNRPFALSKLVLMNEPCCGENLQFCIFYHFYVPHFSSYCNIYYLSSFLFLICMYLFYKSLMVVCAMNTDCQKYCVYGSVWPVWKCKNYATSMWHFAFHIFSWRLLKISAVWISIAFLRCFDAWILLGDDAHFAFVAVEWEAILLPVVGDEG